MVWSMRPIGGYRLDCAASIQVIVKLFSVPGIPPGCLAGGDLDFRHRFSTLLIIGYSHADEI